MLGPPGSAGRQPEGCVPTPESYTRIRRMGPNLRNASLDKLDSCSEVTMGLLATVAVTAAIWVMAMPAFQVGGVPWIRTWETSMMMNLDQYRQNLESSNLLPKSISVPFLVQNVSHDELVSHRLSQAVFKESMARRLAQATGQDITAENVSVVLQPSDPDDPNSTAASCTVGVPAQADAAAVQQAVRDSVPDLVESLESDFASSPKIRAVSQGKVVVSCGDMSIHADAGTSFDVMDENHDGFLEQGEFVNGTARLTPPIPEDEAQHLFGGLDENRNGRLERLEYADALTREQLFYRSDDSFTTATTTSVTETTTTTEPETRTRTTTTTLGPSTPSTTAATTTKEPSTSKAPTTSSRRPVVPKTGPVATVNLRLQGLDWSKLSHAQKVLIAAAFRQDLAYAAGILSSQVMDATGSEGCVSLGAEGAIPEEPDADPATVAQACLPVPEGATVEDIEAVVTSGTETRKIVKDVTPLTGGQGLHESDVAVTVTPTTACHTSPSRQAESLSFCESEDEGDDTTSTAASTTSDSQPNRLISMSEFLQRMGASKGDSARDAFAALDLDGNLFCDPEEFQEATSSAHFHPGLTRIQAEDFFDFLDANKDGRIESIEFYQAFKAAEDEPTLAPSTSPSPRTSQSGPLIFGGNYLKLGIGFCRTAAEALPGSIERPDLTVKEDCQNACDQSDSCGAFAYGEEGLCKLYSSGQEYTDTTPMTHVECFSKVYISTVQQQPNILLVRLVFLNGVLAELNKAEAAAVADELERSISFQIGASVDSTDCGKPVQLSTTSGGMTRHEVSCLIAVSSGEKVEDLVAVMDVPGTAAKLVEDLHKLPFDLKVAAKDLSIASHGTSSRLA